MRNTIEFNGDASVLVNILKSRHANGEKLDIGSIGAMSHARLLPHQRP